MSNPVHLTVIDNSPAIGDTNQNTPPENPTYQGDRALHARALADLIEGDTRFDHHNRMLYATDASAYQVEPIGVIIPKNTKDIIATLNYANQNNLSILPRGAGTALAGQSVNQSIILDLSVYCNHFLNIDTQQNTCTVQPGIILDHLNQTVSKHSADKLFFGPDVATANRATIGGMIGNNSAGAHSILYGRTVKHIKSIKAALADATILDFYQGASQTNKHINKLTKQLAQIILPIREIIRREYPTITRTEGGYNLPILLNQLESSQTNDYETVNLAHLLVGSEGTLAITLEAELNLVLKPKHKTLAVIPFNTIDEAVESVPAILTTNPAAVELLDDQILNLARNNLHTKQFVEQIPAPPNGKPPEAILYIEYFDNELSVINSNLSSLDNLLPHQNITIHHTPAAMDSAWQLRKAAEPLVHALPGLRKPVGFVEDTAVNPTRLPEFVRRFRAIVKKHNTTASYYAHASVGCLHIRPLLDLRNPLDRRAMQLIAEEVTDLIREMRGSFSAEHGFGRARSALLPRRFPKEIIDAFTKIKNIFDPHNRLNPDNLINPRPITQHLRVQPQNIPVRIAPFDTFYNYENDGGLSHAVERCNGAAVCRKESTGLMCPSYMATRDERHSPRGRANALRLALSGQLTDIDNNNSIGKPIFNDPQTLRTLDWCLSCKGCKSECPSIVDIAKYKSEYFAQSHHSANHIPLSSHFFAHINTVSKLASLAPTLTNTLLRFPPLRACLNKTLSIAPHRALPTFKKPFHHWFKSYSQPIPANAPTLILYADCFTNYNEPQIAIDTVRVLNHFGYRIISPNIPCCARPSISQGLLPKAQKQITAAATILNTIIQYKNILAIIICEPSCLSAIRDDWLTLKTSIPANQLNRIASITRLPEQFLEENWNHHPRTPPLRTNKNIARENQPQTILLHGHCHQNALYGMESTIALLKNISPSKTNIITTQGTCCGMAGAFGYRKNNYNLSMKIAELDLFPAIRKLNRSDLILATGTSCRHQIQHGSQKQAQHPIQYIAQQLA